MGFYVANHLTYNIITTSSDIEQLWLKIKFPSFSVALGVAYRPPNTNYNDFLNTFDATVSSLFVTVDCLLCVGDFNIDLFKIGNAEVDLMCTCLETLGLTQIVNQPTRIAEKTSTLIDYILTSNRALVVSVNVVSVHISDHELISCIINIKVDKPKIQFKTVRNFKNINHQQFYSDLQSNTVA